MTKKDLAYSQLNLIYYPVGANGTFFTVCWVSRIYLWLSVYKNNFNENNMNFVH